MLSVGGAGYCKPAGSRYTHKRGKRGAWARSLLAHIKTSPADQATTSSVQAQSAKPQNLVATVEDFLQLWFALPCEMAEDKTPLVVQPGYNHTHTVVFLHGRGNTAFDFLRSLPYARDSQNRSLAEIYPSFRWVFPWAPVTNTALDGRLLSQWFDVWNVNDFSDREELQVEGLKDSVGSIIQLLVAEADALGGHWDRLVLMGISQGAATGVHTMLHLHHQAPRLGAFVGFSSRMPFPRRTLAETRKALFPASESDEAAELLQRTPMLLEHCIDDPLVLVQDGKALGNTLREFGADVTWKEYSDGGHWFNSPQGIDDVVEFINRALGLR